MATGGGENYSENENGSEIPNKNCASKSNNGLENETSPSTNTNASTTGESFSKIFISV